MVNNLNQKIEFRLNSNTWDQKISSKIIKKRKQKQMTLVVSVASTLCVMLLLFNILMPSNLNDFINYNSYLSSYNQKFDYTDNIYDTDWSYASETYFQI